MQLGRNASIRINSSIVFVRLFPGDWRHFIIYAIGSLESLNTRIFHIFVDCVCVRACMHVCVHVHAYMCLHVCVEGRVELVASSPIPLHLSFGMQSLTEPRALRFGSAQDLPMSHAHSIAPFSVNVGYLNLHPRQCLYCIYRGSAHWACLVPDREFLNHHPCLLS